MDVDKSGWSPKRVASGGDEIAAVAALRLVRARSFVNLV